VLPELMRRAGQREAFVAMDCLRGSVPARLHPENARNYLLAYAIPYVWLMPREMTGRRAHLIVATMPRIPEVRVNPRAKNFHWADVALSETQDKGADNPVLLDTDGNVTEGPGFNVFAVTDGVVATPDHGVLDGITRLAVIQMCETRGMRCKTRTVPLAELRNADEVFISSTAGGMMGVTRLDERILDNGRPGPVTERLHDAYWWFRRERWCSELIGYAGAEAPQ
jgi:branched-chain amino acid aminotransferase